MQILRPSEHHSLGRQVQNFEQKTWDSEREYVMLGASYAKFSRNNAMLQYLLRTGDVCFVEASPDDVVWGIGRDVLDQAAAGPRRWRCQNLLGHALPEGEGTATAAAIRPSFAS